MINLKEKKTNTHINEISNNSSKMDNYFDN